MQTKTKENEDMHDLYVPCIAPLSLTFGSLSSLW